MRSRIVLLAADGMSDEDIAQKLDIDWRVAARWRVLSGRRPAVCCKKLRVRGARARRTLRASSTASHIPDEPTKQVGTARTASVRGQNDVISRPSALRMPVRQWVL